MPTGGVRRARLSEMVRHTAAAAYGRYTLRSGGVREREVVVGRNRRTLLTVSRNVWQDI